MKRAWSPMQMRKACGDCVRLQGVKRTRSPTTDGKGVRWRATLRQQGRPAVGRLRGSGCVVGRDVCELRYFRHSFFVSEHSSLPMEQPLPCNSTSYRKSFLPTSPRDSLPCKGRCHDKVGTEGSFSIRLFLFYLHYITFILDFVIYLCQNMDII
jgi:hypothetical protein